MANVPQPDSFLFAGVDMLEAYGVRCIASDVLLPKLRPRKITVPSRDGGYDFGARYYDERTLKLACETLAALSRQAIREVSLLLGRKGRIVLWDEPDKYYVGRIYDSAQLKYLGLAGHEFTLTFTCDPFAYGATRTETLQVRMAYDGTARTPTRMQITNTGTAAVAGVRVRIRERSDS